MWKFPRYEINQPLDWEDLESRYSWISDMKGVQQDAEWHAEGDVFVHTRMVVEALIALPEFKTLSEQEKHILVTAALMHDIEKRSCTTTEVIAGKERIVSPKHAKKGEFTARTILYKDLTAPFEIREQICKLVRLHGLPLWAIQKTDPRKEVIKASLVVNTQWVSMLAKADVLGRICKDQDEILLRIELFNELCKENDCWGIPRIFESDYARYFYLNRKEVAPDYVPFDDTICTVTMMCALPGSGKDTYISKNIDLPILSLDDIRREHKISPTDKRGNGRVVQLGKEKAKEFLRSKQDFVFNATNLTKDMRSKWISLFVEYNAKTRIVYLEVPYKVMHKQNKDREHQVPSDVIDRLVNKLEMPSYDEATEVIWV